MGNSSNFRSGLIGRGITASRSPRIHQAEAAAHGTAMVYELLDSTELGRADSELGAWVRHLADAGYCGCNVTFPFKQAVIEHCDNLSEAAAALGAVNTLVFENGSVRGENTDWVGFTWLIEREFGNIAATRIAQVGAGGAGSATAFALARLGAGEVALFDPDFDRANSLADRLATRFPNCRFVACASVNEAISGSSGVVNATPVGMISVPGLPFDPALLQPGQWLADIIYFPLETRLLAAAARTGHKVANGISMVVGQAAEAFRLMTGLEPDRERMLARLQAEIASERRMGDAA